MAHTWKHTLHLYTIWGVSKLILKWATRSVSEFRPKNNTCHRYYTALVRILMILQNVMYNMMYSLVSWQRSRGRVVSCFGVPWTGGATPWFSDYRVQGRPLRNSSLGEKYFYRQYWTWGASSFTSHHPTLY